MLRDELKNIDSSPEALRKFGVAIGIALVMFSWILLRLHGGHIPYVLAAAGMALLILGLAVPTVLRPIQRPWMTLSVTIGWVMTNVLTSLFFFLMVTPVGLAMRISGKDILETSIDRNRESYWIRRPQEAIDPASYEKQF